MQQHCESVPRVAEAGGFVETDARGRFRLHVRETDSGLIACAPGLRTPLAGCSPDRLSGETVGLEMLPTRTVQGRVVNASGAPLAGARGQARWLGMMGVTGSPHDVITSDADGRFRYELDPELSAELTFQTPEGSATVVLAPSAEGPVVVRIGRTTVD
ncbi:MAG: carboxypeptidase-like regulatory domain-containing protein [Sandaracinaceae bacterium]